MHVNHNASKQQQPEIDTEKENQIPNVILGSRSQVGVQSHTIYFSFLVSINSCVVVFADDNDAVIRYSYNY